MNCKILRRKCNLCRKNALEISEGQNGRWSDSGEGEYGRRINDIISMDNVKMKEREENQ